MKKEGGVLGVKRGRDIDDIMVLTPMEKLEREEGRDRKILLNNAGF